MTGENLIIGKVYFISCHSPGSRPSYPKLKKGKYILSKVTPVTNTFKVKGQSSTFILTEHDFK